MSLVGFTMPSTRMGQGVRFLDVVAVVVVVIVVVVVVVIVIIVVVNPVVF